MAQSSWQVLRREQCQALLPALGAGPWGEVPVYLELLGESHLCGVAPAAPVAAENGMLGGCLSFMGVLAPVTSWPERSFWGNCVRDGGIVGVLGSPVAILCPCLSS